jgi:glutathione peroxidase
MRFEALEGGAMPLSQWKGKALLVVNTASFCGYTPQFEALAELWQTYRDQGLVVIGVSSNSFRQEAKNAQKVREVCTLVYGADFPMTATVSVKGRDAHPFFRWAEQQGGRTARPSWNFNKYLVGRDGSFLGHWRSKTRPMSPNIRSAVEKALAADA